MIIEIRIPRYEKRDGHEIILDCCGVSWYGDENIFLSRTNYEDVCVLQFWSDEEAKAAYENLLNAAETGRMARVTARKLEDFEEDDE